jgi:hypothetical protein
MSTAALAQAFTLGANDYLVKLPDKVELIAAFGTIRAATSLCWNATKPTGGWKRASASWPRSWPRRRVT